MKTKRLGFLCAALLLASVPVTGHAQDLPPIVHDCDYVDPERPYVCDVGPPKPLSMRSFKELLATDSALRAVVRRIGMPYAAEMQRVRTESPWYSWEVRTYYPNYDRMCAFARAFILNVPEVSLLRFEGKIPANRWRATAAVQQAAYPGGDAEGAAARAERAAEEAERLADQATRFADQADAIADQADQSFKRSLVKQ
jgi:hypothetical protein